MKWLCLILLAVMCTAGLAAQTIGETLAQIEATKLELAQNEQLVEQTINELRATNPLFAPQGSLESNIDYLERRSHISQQFTQIRKQYLEHLWIKVNNLYTRAYETKSITVTFGNYDTKNSLWDLIVVHSEHRKERYEVKAQVDAAMYQAISSNTGYLDIKGILSVDYNNKISLVKLIVKDPGSGKQFTHHFQPVQKITNDTINAYAVSPNGLKIAAAIGNTLRIYDFQDISKYNDFNLAKTASSLSFTPDSKKLAVSYLESSNVYRIKLMLIEPLGSIAEWSLTSSTNAIVAVSPDGLLLAVGCEKKVVIYNLDNYKPLCEFGLDGSANSLSFGHDGKLLATSSGSRAIVFNLENRQQVFVVNRDQIISQVAINNDSTQLAVGCVDDYAYLYDLKTKKSVASYENGYRIAFCPTDDYLAVSSAYDGIVHQYYGQKNSYIIEIKNKKYEQSYYKTSGRLRFSPDGCFLLIGNSIYRTFITAAGSPSVKKLAQPPKLTAKLTFSEPSGNDYLDAFEKGSIKVLVTNTGQGSANSLIVKLTPAKLAGLNYLNGYISEIPAGNTVELDIPIEAYIDVKDGTHTLDISFEEANGFPPAPLAITFSTRAFRRPELYIAETGIDDSNKNGRIEAGEMIELTLRFRNRGDGPASAAYAKFYAGDNAFLTEKHAKTQSLGNLTPSETRDLKLELFINERCANEIPLYVDLTEATGLAGVAKLRVPILKSDQTRPVTSLVVTGTDHVYDISEPASLNIDVEADLPQARQARIDDFAVIFGVENYSGDVPRVLYATRDAAWFREYALQALGIPAENIYYRVNAEATKNEFDKAFGKNGWLDKRAKKDSRVYFFFSGHGIPAPKGQSAYILPYDGDPNYADLTAYPLENAYAGLAGLKSALNVVLLDACFTGVNRENQALYATSRPVFISPNPMEAPPRVNVLSAADWNQMSNAWPEKQHGLFSYFLLKGMQGAADANSDRKLTLGEMHEYLSREVPIQAARLDKEQVPQLSSEQQNEVWLEYK